MKSRLCSKWKKKNEKTESFIISYSSCETRHVTAVNRFFFFLQIIRVFSYNLIFTRALCTSHYTKPAHSDTSTSSYLAPWRHALWLASRSQSTHPGPRYSPWFLCQVLWRQYRAIRCTSSVRLSNAAGSRMTSRNPIETSGFIFNHAWNEKKNY